MARIRSIKPEICESETMARCSAEVERTFCRLWTHCDDHGRAKDHPGLIKAALFPLHDDVTPEVIDSHLATLADEGLIVRYTVGGKRFLACPSWGEHQHPQKPRPSKLPDPSDADPVAVQDVSRTAPVVVPDGSGPVVGEVVGAGGDLVEGDGEPSIGSQDYTGSAVTESVEPMAANGERVDSEPVVDEQLVRKTAVLVGRAVAAGQAGVGNHAGYAHKVTAGILDPSGDGLDRARIVRALTAGEAPEAVAAGWSVDPFGLGAAERAPEPPRPVLSTAVVDEIRHQADEALPPADGLAQVRAIRGQAS